MDRPITRRDFINGVSMAAAGSLLPGVAMAAGTYPPALMGMRGSHAGSWEIAHALRDGQTFEGEPTGEIYDLVVVGGGISGLSAAYFYRQRLGGAARILIIDNHDDFGGHAKRNEFTYGGRTVIGYGGTQSIDTPSSYSPEAMGLLKELGIEVDTFNQAFDRELYPSLGLARGVFFDQETFGVDKLVVQPQGMSTLAFAAEAPLAEPARLDLVRLVDEPIDYLPGLSETEKKTLLVNTSYLAYLRDYAKVHEDVIRYLYSRTHGLFAMGIDGVPALDCWALGYPGFSGLNLTRGDFPGLSATAKPKKVQDPYIYHFPDGNASIARLLVRSLVPEVASGNTMEDVVTARFDYEQLDREGARVRIRVSSTGVGVKEVGEEVQVTYVRGDKAERVSAGHVVLACYNAVIPRLCPEMSKTQREALVYGPKVPLVYSNVFIRNWTSFQKLGVSNIYHPSGYHSSVSLDFPVSLGAYEFSHSPEEPMVLHLLRTPCAPGGSSREQHAAGRYNLLSTDFETFEFNIRDQLGRSLAGGGFDPAQDILGITVNRWPHGYAYEYNSLWDPIFAEGEAPCEIARQPFGRIHIANSDAQAYAYTNAAIDQAFRAVLEITS